MSTHREIQRIRFCSSTTVKSKLPSLPSLGRKRSSQSGDRTNFCGEGALTGKPLRMGAAITISECKIIRLEKEVMVRILHEEPEFSDYFLQHVLTRTARVEADLVDQLCNDSEMRLARALLLLANCVNDVGQEPVPINVNQETLAALIGTTRPRVNFFLNKFRRLGLITYNGKLEVRKAMLDFVLNEKPRVHVKH